MGDILHHSKAVIFFQDITDSTRRLKKDQGFTLQYFNYECSRKRNTSGMPYGPTLPSLLHFTLKSLPDGYLKDLYQGLTENTVSNFSIVFNAMFRMDDIEGMVLSDYDSALLVTGMVVDVSEDYDVTSLYTDSDDSHNLMKTTVKFLLQSITYIGSNDYQKKLPINY